MGIHIKTDERAIAHESFLKDVASHAMRIVKHDGLYRHLRFVPAEAETSSFDIVSWPGVLCINCDMGNFMLVGSEDMFPFFEAGLYGRNLDIRPELWSRSLRAVDREGYEKFSSKLFRVHVKKEFDKRVKGRLFADEAVAPARKKDLWKEVQDQVLSGVGDSEREAFDLARRFVSTSVPDFKFKNCSDWNCREYTAHYIWCCFAIVWGIKAYQVSRADFPF